MAKLGVIGCVGVLVLALILGVWGIGSYNGLVKLDQEVQGQWAQVESAYQRRADLVPNLVETVKGAAAFEKDTFTAVADARSRLGQVSGGAVPNVPNDAEAFQKFQEAQAGVSSALSRPTAVVAE